MFLLYEGAETLAQPGPSGGQRPAAAAAGHQPNQIPVQTKANRLLQIPQREQAGRLHLGQVLSGQGQGDCQEDPEGCAAEATLRGSDCAPQKIFPRAHTGRLVDG